MEELYASYTMLQTAHITQVYSSIIHDALLKQNNSFRQVYYICRLIFYLIFTPFSLLYLFLYLSSKSTHLDVMNIYNISLIYFLNFYRTSLPFTHACQH